MGANVDRVRNLLKEKPMTAGEMALRIFESEYTNSDKDMCSNYRKIKWGRGKVSSALRSLRSFDEVDYELIPNTNTGSKMVKLWYLKDM